MEIIPDIKRKHQHAILLFMLVLLHFLVKGFFLGDKSLAGDEPFSVYHAQMSIKGVVDQLSQGNNPPLYEILLHFWIKIFGISEFSVRFPSLIFSGFTTLLLFKTGTKFFNSRVGTYASLIFIFSNYHILLAQEARVYALLGMLSMLSMYLFMGILKEHQNLTIQSPKKTSPHLSLRPTVLLALVNVLLMYSHYFGFFILWTQFLFLLFDASFFVRRWKTILLYVGLFGIGYAPQIKVVLYRFIDSSGGTWVQAPEGIESLYNMLWTFSNAPLVTVVVLALFGAAMMRYIFHFKTAKTNPFSPFVTFWFWSIVLFMFGVSFWIPIFMDRYVMPAAVAFPLLIGICADSLVKKSWYRFAIPLAICLLFIATVKPNSSNGRDIKAIISKIKTMQTDRTWVFFCPDWFDLNFVYYYNPVYFMDANEVQIKENIRKNLHRDRVFPISHAIQMAQQPLMPGDKILYLDTGADFTYPENQIRMYLDDHFEQRQAILFDELFQLFEYHVR
jgi:mannosyltransferase